jgi:hypothetical protein
MRKRRYFGNRRDAFRYPLAGQATLEIADGTVTVSGNLLDISTSGVAIHACGTDLKPLLGVVAVLTMESEDLPAPVFCYVTLASQIGLPGGDIKVGLELLGIDDDNLARVTAYRALAMARAAVAT